MLFFSDWKDYSFKTAMHNLVFNMALWYFRKSSGATGMELRWYVHDIDTNETKNGGGHPPAGATAVRLDFVGRGISKGMID